MNHKNCFIFQKIVYFTIFLMIKTLINKLQNVISIIKNTDGIEETMDHKGRIFRNYGSQGEAILEIMDLKGEEL